MLTQPKNWGNFNPLREQTSMAENVHFTQGDETPLLHGIFGSTMIKALCYKSEGRWF
jgi:hypothetical protein